MPDEMPPHVDSTDIQADDDLTIELYNSDDETVAAFEAPLVLTMALAKLDPGERERFIADTLRAGLEHTAYGGEDE